MTTRAHPENTNVSQASITGQSARNIRMRIVLAIAWLILVAAGFAATLYITQAEQARDESQWQQQLQLSASSTAAQIEQWVSAQQKTISDLAQNEALAIYLAEIAPSFAPERSNIDAGEATSVGTDRETSLANEDAIAFKGYLQNLLIAEARKHNFAMTQLETVDANIELPPAIAALPGDQPAQGGGIAIFSRDRSLITSTADFPEIVALPPEAQQSIFELNPTSLAPFLFKDKSYNIFTAPIRAVQADESAAPIGYVVGMRWIDASLNAILTSPASNKSSETLVVQLVNDAFQHVPMMGVSGSALALSVNKNDATSAIAYSATHIGEVAIKRDFLGNNVLAVAEPVLGTNWFVVSKVNESVAMASAKMQQKWLLLGYLLLVGFITSTLLALWQSNKARHEANAFENYRNNVDVEEQKLTDTSQTQKKYQDTLSELIQTLVALVDSRDPNAQGHSEYVSYIAHELAVEMQLSDDEIRATTLAGRLMNVGKIKTPESQLLNADLSEEEKKNIRNAMRRSADILEHIPFDVPVVETLRQAQEHVDGSGPLGLKSTAILPSAKIIAIVNAFVALISNRPHREAMDSQEALEIIRASVDTKYYRKAYVALENFLVNGGGVVAIDKFRKRERLKQHLPS